ncbi:uncharacterized protein LOC102673860 isoform X1 [Apis dorsata]|uniref:uncharacterized protein LOC102673860 isoform X1 n=1 Tax=Apis dorsata TaxID=7462 RepID=UPI00129347A8|nr:uncharacterized protein LOC102673860 isoform X1 [Apis dorsata]
MGIRNEAEEVKRIWRGLEGGRGPKGPRGGQGAPGSGVRGGRGNAKGACGPRRGARGQLISECGSDLILYRARCDSSLSSSFDTSLCALGKTEQAVADLKFTYWFGPCPQLEQQMTETCWLKEAITTFRMTLAW